jgi:hypothetical protein
MEMNITSNAIYEISEKLKQRISNAESEKSQNLNGDTSNAKLNELLEKMNPKTHVQQITERGTQSTRHLSRAMNTIFKTEEQEYSKATLKEDTQNINVIEREENYDAAYKIFNRNYIRRAIETKEGMA